MDDDVFVQQIRSAVVEEAINNYATLLDTVTPTEVRDKYWKDVLAARDTLGPEGRPSLINVMRLIAIDTVSHILGILDGTSPIGGKLVRFKVLDESGHDLAGNLQDYFLADDS